MRPLLLLWLLVNRASTQSVPTPLPTVRPSQFTYTGASENLTIPDGVYQVTLKMWGAGGGGGYFWPNGGRMQATGFGGGAGGFTYCVLPVASGQVLSFMVGGAGLSSAYTPGVWDLKLAGGYGGGGRSWGSGVDASAGSGGGRSAVFRAGQELVTAGGGGGGGVQCKNDATNYMAAGGGGGGLTAPLTGNFYTTTTTGGSQTAGGVSSCGGTTGGSRGSGGNAVAYGPGGGGGYFGGAGSCDLGCISPGGSGGSSYIAQCLLGSYSIAGSKGGMPGSAQALPPNTTDVVSYVTGNGVGGLAQINAAGRGGHGLIAISYAYSPTAVPTPAPTKPSPAPTAVPTTPPTRVPTFGAPTPLPTRRPSQMAPAIGPYFFQTLHGGSECRSMPARYTVETFVLGLCMPPDELNSAPYVVSCKKSIYGVSSSLWISRYSSADGTCKAGPASGPVSLSRGRSCEQQPRGAGYELSQCGDIPLSIRARQQLLIKAYPQVRRQRSFNNQ